MFNFQLGMFDSNGGRITQEGLWMVIAFTLVVELVFYVFRSIGVYVLAKRQKLEKAWFAFVPCLWLYTVCKLLKKQKFFGKPYEKMAIWLCLIFTVTQILNLVYQILVYYPVFDYVLFQGLPGFAGCGKGENGRRGELLRSHGQLWRHFGRLPRKTVGFAGRQADLRVQCQ